MFYLSEVHTRGKGIWPLHGKNMGQTALPLKKLKQPPNRVFILFLNFAILTPLTSFGAPLEIVIISYRPHCLPVTYERNFF